MFAISFALSFTDSGKPRRSARRRRSAFARFTRYSASDICPAIATAVVSSRGKIFWTTLDPTKNPFDARLSAARTTPSLLRIPTVVVMSNLARPMSGVGYVDSNLGGRVTLPQVCALTRDRGGTGWLLQSRSPLRPLLDSVEPWEDFRRDEHRGDTREKSNRGDNPG